MVWVVDDLCCGKDNRYVGIDELMNGWTDDWMDTWMGEQWTDRLIDE